MLTKSFFFYVYSLFFNITFYFVTLIFVLVWAFLFANVRRKFLFFTLIIQLFGVIGFFFNLDGLSLIFLTAEFTIILLLLMTYTQLYGQFSFTTKTSSSGYIIPLILLTFSCNTPSISIISYTSFYNLISHVITSDFFILYYFLFEKVPMLVIYISLIISFFSFFFIVLYFVLKLLKNSDELNKKNYFFLRKQQLLKQTTITSKVYGFQN